LRIFHANIIYGGQFQIEIITSWLSWLVKVPDKFRGLGSIQKLDLTEYDTDEMVRLKNEG